MTQEFVKLPREVVELALEALKSDEEMETAFYLEISALRAALDQLQANQPAMTPIAQRKLDSLLAEGYTISGYSIYHEQKHQHGFVTGAGLVGWWKPEGMEYPQPQGEQEPVGKLIADPYEGHIFIPYGDSWPFNEDLYTHPQPKHEPLTDEQIADAVRGFYSSDKAAELGFPDDACTARAIERAHNIK